MQATRSQVCGFTLIELMISVAIVGILAAIAYPSYRSSMQRSWRADASACLLEMAQGMERRFAASTAMSYAFADTTARDAFLDAGCAQEGGMPTRYDFSFAADPTATVFSLRAVPVNPGPQTNDACGTLTVNQLGAKGASGSVEDCWRR